jgi:hypothetical protein
MIGPKEAVASAEAYVRELYSESNLKGLRLEEIEQSADGKYWLITLGWWEPRVIPNTVNFDIMTRGENPPRVYKTFKVDSESGAVLAMKIRKVD